VTPWGGFQTRPGKIALRLAPSAPPTPRVAMKKCGIVGVHPLVRPPLRADTWVRPSKKIVACRQIGIIPAYPPPAGPCLRSGAGCWAPPVPPGA
jgi:hypothetical protein